MAWIRSSGPLDSPELAAAFAHVVQGRDLPGASPTPGARTRLSTQSVRLLKHLVLIASDGVLPETLRAHFPSGYERSVLGEYFRLKHTPWASPAVEVEACLTLIAGGQVGAAAPSVALQVAATGRLVDHGDECLPLLLARYGTWDPGERDWRRVMMVLDVIRSTPGGGDVCRPIVDRWLQGPPWLAELAFRRGAAWLARGVLYPFREHEVYNWEGHNSGLAAIELGQHACEGCARLYARVEELGMHWRQW